MNAQGEDSLKTRWVWHEGGEAISEVDVASMTATPPFSWQILDTRFHLLSFHA